MRSFLDMAKEQLHLFGHYRNNIHVVYKNALNTLDIESLSDRRTDLCLKFATKSLKHNKYSDWFCSSEKTVNTRIVKQNLKPVHYRLERFNKSPLSYLTRLLNENQS